jgi:hypothetical protein
MILKLLLADDEPGILALLEDIISGSSSFNVKSECG